MLNDDYLRGHYPNDCSYLLFKITSNWDLIEIGTIGNDGRIVQKQDKYVGLVIGQGKVR